MNTVPHSEPLPGLAHMWAAPGRHGIVAVAINSTPGIKGSGSATLYDLAEFRRLLAELTEVANQAEQLLSLPADQPIPGDITQSRAETSSEDPWRLDGGADWADGTDEDVKARP